MARFVRSRETYGILAMAVIGSAAIAAVWRLGGTWWVGLPTALVGMAGGAGLIWLARIFGSAALGREAMGFGDVTLMGMIGAFLGWQTCLIVFFLAPLAGLVLGVAQLILRRGSGIPLWAVFVPRRVGDDRLLGADLELGHAGVLFRLARARGDVRLPRADGDIARVVEGGANGDLEG